MTSITTPPSKSQQSTSSAIVASQELRKEQIRAQAKSIMDNFFIALKNANIADHPIGVNRKEQTRLPEPRANGNDDSFRHGMFANAPNKDINHIVAEKKSW